MTNTDGMNMKIYETEKVNWAKEIAEKSNTERVSDFEIYEATEVLLSELYRVEMLNKQCCEGGRHWGHAYGCHKTPD